MYRGIMALQLTTTSTSDMAWSKAPGVSAESTKSILSSCRESEADLAVQASALPCERATARTAQPASRKAGMIDEPS